VYKKILSILLLISYLNSDNSAYVNLNNDDIEAGLEIDLMVRDELQASDSRYLVGFNYLKPDKKDALLDLRVVGQGQFYVGYDSLFIGIGAKGVRLNSDFYALPLGIALSYNLDGLPIGRITLMGQVFYSPTPLTFSKGTHYTEWRTELSYTVIPLAKLYVGYRDISMDFDDTYTKETRNFDYSSSAYFGLKFIF
jgi:hypothetical protein